MKRRLVTSAILIGVLKVILIVFSLLYVLDKYFSMSYNIALLPQSELWSIVPLLLVFFCVAVVLLKVIAKLNKEGSASNANKEADALIKYFFDISWLVPINLCAALAGSVGIVILYIGFVVSLLLLIFIKCYQVYICQKSINPNESAKDNNGKKP